MFCNNLILVIDPPGAIEELSHFDLSLGIGASVGPGQIQNQTSNPNAVIIAHDRAIAEADHSIQIELWRDLAPGFLRLSGGIAKRRLNLMIKILRNHLPLLDSGLLRGEVQR